MLEEIKKALEPIAASVKEATEKMLGIEKSQNETKDAIKSMTERVEKIEKLPIIAAPAIKTISSEYKGFKLSKQGQFIREIAGKEGQRFSAFRDEQKVDEFCKFMIDVISKATLNETTGSQGAYLVPDEFQWDIAELARNSSYALQFCTVLNMSSDQLYVPAELTLPAVAWKGESVQLAQSDPTYAQVSLAAKKLTAYSAATNELLSDSAMDVVGMLTRQFVYGIGMELDNQMLNGTGDPVSGVLTAKAGYSVSSTGTSFSNVTGTDISLMVSKIEEGWARDARFIFGRLGMHYIRTLKDSQNNFIFSQIGGGQQKSIWDYPANMSEKITNTDADATAYGVFGNFKYFYIGRRQGAMAIEVDPYTRFDYAETRFRMVTRWAMAVAQANAFCRLLS